MTNASKTNASVAREIDQARGMSPMMAAMTGMTGMAIDVAESDALWSELERCPDCGGITKWNAETQDWECTP